MSFEICSWTFELLELMFQKRFKRSCFIKLRQILKEKGGWRREKGGERGRRGGEGRRREGRREEGGGRREEGAGRREKGEGRRKGGEVCDFYPFD